MKKIKLTQGKVALVDNWNYAWLIKRRWYAHLESGKWYAWSSAKINGKWGIIKLHRLIMKTPEELEADHIDGNSLNCQEHNMRNCTRIENARNVGSHSDSVSKYVGVTYNSVLHKAGRRYYIRAKICVSGEHINLGNCKTEEQAARRHDSAAKYFFGEFANLNFKQNE